MKSDLERCKSFGSIQKNTTNKRKLANKGNSRGAVFQTKAFQKSKQMTQRQ